MLKKGEDRSFLCKWIGRERIKSREEILLDKRKEEQVMEKGKKGCRRQHHLRGDFYLYGRGCSWIFGVQSPGFQERANTNTNSTNTIQILPIPKERANTIQILPIPKNLSF